MFSRFFIERPIFASVISIIIVFAGGVALLTLPIAQYPEIVPPVVQVKAYYAGADPQVIADTVAAPIEQQVNGVENMLYMSSQSAADGSYTLNVTFELGTDMDMNTVLTQNRVAAALAQLPDQFLRDIIGRAGHDDRIKRGRLRPSVVSISGPGMDVPVSETPERLRRLPRQFGNELDCVNFLSQLREHRRLVA